MTIHNGYQDFLAGHYGSKEEEEVCFCALVGAQNDEIWALAQQAMERAYGHRNVTAWRKV